MLATLQDQALLGSTAVLCNPLAGLCYLFEGLHYVTFCTAALILKCSAADLSNMAEMLERTLSENARSCSHNRDAWLAPCLYN